MRKPWVVLPGVLLVAIVLSCPARICGAADAEQKKESQLRTVFGAVLDKDDSPLPTGVVYLKNLRTLTVRTYIADDKGEYRFSGLDPNVDYEIHAEHGDFTSPKRTISSFDSRREISITLKVDKKKGGK